MMLKVEQIKSWFRKHSHNNATLEGVDYTNDQDQGQSLSHGLRLPATASFQFTPARRIAEIIFAGLDTKVAVFRRS